MSEILIWHCSPRPGGVSDTLAWWYASAAAEPGANIRHIYLRDYQIAPCNGCNACFAPPHACVLDTPHDAARGLFENLLAASVNIFFSPVYFYALPAHFKAWVDRGQRYWNVPDYSGSAIATRKMAKKSQVIMCAGRQRGNLLFAGGLRTLAWFLKLFDIALAGNICIKGVNDPEDLAKNGEYENMMREAGKNWKELLP